MIPRLSTLSLCILALAACGQTQTYQTTLEKSPTSEQMPDNIDRIVLTYDYANPLSGPQSLRVDYYAGTRRLFVDNAFINGEMQDLAGAKREDLFFEFDSARKELRQWTVGAFDPREVQTRVYTTNDGISLQEDGYVFIDVYDGGALIESTGSTPWSHETILVEPGQAD